MEIVELVKEAYKEANAHLRWQQVLKYGAAAFGAYTVYNFGVKPFLSPLRQMPGPCYGPLFGNVREAMVGEAMETSVGWIKKYGGVVHFYHLLGRDRVLVADPAALRHVLYSNEKNYDRPTGARFIGRSIFTVSGDDHKFLRRLMNEFFSQESVNSYISAFHTYGERLIEKWEDALVGHTQIKVPVTTDLKKMAFDILGKTIFNTDFNCLSHEPEVAVAIQKVLAAPNISFAQVIPFLSWFPTRENKEQAQSLAIIDSFIYDLIAKKRKLMETNTDDEEIPKDIMSKMLMARDSETGKGLDDKSMRDNVLSLFIAGHETTAVTMSWLLLTLAQHPDIQQKLREEVNSQFPPRGVDATWKDLESMPYLNAVIKETQRLFPAAPTFTRRAINDDVIGGYPVPKGTLVTYHVGAMMRDPSLWKEPEKFAPERFLDDAEYDLYTHIPFATGPHKCLGHQFAKVEMKHILASLIREFEFSLVPGTHYKRKLRITLNPNPPVELLITKVEE